MKFIFGDSSSCKNDFLKCNFESELDQKIGQITDNEHMRPYLEADCNVVVKDIAKSIHQRTGQLPLYQ